MYIRFWRGHIPLVLCVNKVSQTGVRGRAPLTHENFLIRRINS